MKSNILYILIILFHLYGCKQWQEHRLDITEGLLLDLNADAEVKVVSDSLVISWRNQVSNAASKDYIYTDAGRTIPGSGRPLLNKNAEGLNGHSSIIFREDELINDNDNAFHGLITGKGYTWMVIIKPYKQERGGGNYPQAFFGCLRNSAPPQNEEGQFAGFWGSFYIDGKVWMSSRSGEGEFSRGGYTTPEVVGPYLPINKWYIVSGRQAAGGPGTTVDLELFVDDPSKPIATGKYPVSSWEPSRMAIGTERNAINHQGGESFDGELARILIYDRPVSSQEMEAIFNYLKLEYGILEK
ncbi:hypothetical protein [Flexithrix dorotheae]|uniref:hypothetical protein n=1 Tax=Flexithrix dorotheae TaxID=70993 RepID=UPI0003633113|nr:hypothetical protein [Flexithrix dorotheae]